MKRLLDLCLAVPTAAVLALRLLMLVIAVKVSSSGPVLYWYDREGRDNRIFRMPRLRRLRTGTPAVATHRVLSAYGHDNRDTPDHESHDR
ncbi:MAG: hypothetical protein CRU78_13475 [Candidatus Accumulibacter phosphatis]|uniref:Bacterial sugar transferase domain-containing protein n=1 Tax=Candidatus Accumulibacter phosphatis TaxID=327160 RepID=A0A6A7RVQ9_9PROT|nr:hypothetical protein [Candidatus Accumulibacter phosphatis]